MVVARDRLEALCAPKGHEHVLSAPGLALRPPLQAGKHEGPTPEEEEQERLLEWLQNKLRQLKAERRANLRREQPRAASPETVGGGSPSPEKTAGSPRNGGAAGGPSGSHQGRRANAAEEKRQEKRWR